MAGLRPARPGFTLIELLVAIAIIAMLMAIVGVAWRSVTDTNIQAKAINTISTYASVVRNYAIRHQLETVLMIDPRTGQLDAFVWDTVGDSAGAIAPNTRYVYAPILDEAAKLPNRGDPSRPDNLDVRIVPIDYQERKYNNEPRWNRNLNLFSLCFSPEGRLTQRGLAVTYDRGPADPNSTVSFIERSPLDPTVDSVDQWFYVDTSRGGIVYAAENPMDDPNDPNKVDRAPEQSKLEFLINQYTGRVIFEGVR